MSPGSSQSKRVLWFLPCRPLRLLSSLMAVPGTLSGAFLALAAVDVGCCHNFSKALVFQLSVSCFATLTPVISDSATPSCSALLVIFFVESIFKMEPKVEVMLALMWPIRLIKSFP